MAELKVGDLVRWKAGTNERVGVIREIKPDGVCVIERQTKEGDLTEEISPGRIERIASTVEPEAPAAE